MKHIHLLCLWIAVSIPTFGQVVIQPNQVFQPGIRYEVSNEYLFFSEIDTGQAGQNQVYALSGLTTALLDTVQIRIPSQAPLGPVLPGDRVLLRNPGLRYSHYLSLANGILTSHGFGGTPSAPALPYLPGEVLATFPMAFGQTHSGKFTAPIKFYVGSPILTPFVVDSIRRKQTVRYSWKIDGEGELQSPLGTFPVLRQRVFKAISDTADFLRGDNQTWLNAFETSYTEEVLFYYWSPSVGIPVVMLRDIGNGGFINDVEFITRDLTTTQAPDRTLAATPEDVLFPNPARDKITIRSSDVTKPLSSVQVFTPDGKQILNAEGGLPELTLSFPSGLKGTVWVRHRNRTYPIHLE